MREVMKKNLKIILGIAIITLLMVGFFVYKTIMDRTVDKFVQISDMNVPRIGHTTTLLKDGRVLIIGGYRAEKKAEIYDPINNKFFLIDDTNFEHYLEHLTFLMPDGKVVVIDKDGIETFDPVTNKFSITGKMLIPRRYFAATKLSNNKILITGGYEEKQGHPLVAQAELCDLVKYKCVFASKMEIPRIFHETVLLPNGEIAIIGGETRDNKWNRNYPINVDLYNPEIDKFSHGGNIKTPRIHPILVLLKNGKILILGGYQKGENLNKHIRVVELYDPKDQETSILKDFIPYDDAIKLSNGKILLIGNTKNSSIFEIYDPAAEDFKLIDKKTLTKIIFYKILFTK
ncbi:MAG: hypothetical protein A2104_02895 [Candidatus Melainabacteria bacterium GWF2_32_7]|nr:MAG: hypothetical protein A2104_02895 [Candidatus Melainabacteria bacterium GWF2_32_7]